jgi:hypothetical protein
MKNTKTKSLARQHDPSRFPYALMPGGQVIPKAGDFITAVFNRHANDLRFVATGVFREDPDADVKTLSNALLGTYGVIISGFTSQLNPDEAKFAVKALLLEFMSGTIEKVITDGKTDAQREREGISVQ